MEARDVVGVLTHQGNMVMRKKSMKSWEKRVMMRPAGWMLFWFLAGMAIAGNPGASAGGEKLSLTGTLEFDAGEFLKARTSGYGGNSEPREPLTVDHIWFGHAISTLNLLSKPNDFFTVRSSFEFRQYSTMLPLTPGARRDPYFGTTYWNAFFIREGQGIFSLMNGEAFKLDLAFGYMPYKYNPDVRNLGEFLFRSGTYPLFLINEFERPFARLLGLKSSTSLDLDFLKVKADVFGLIEHEIKPFNDISLAGVGSINFMNYLEIGGGFNLAHLIPVDSRFTELKEESNSYFYDSVRVVTFDTINLISDTSWSRDTGYYTYQGTKLMARASFDIVGLLQCIGIKRGDGSFVSDLFGPVGGKVYSEYAIIGLENFPGGKNNTRGYMSVAERSPWIVGIAAPTSPFATYAVYPEMGLLLYEIFKPGKFKLDLRKHLYFFSPTALPQLAGWAIDKFLFSSSLEWNKKVCLDEMRIEIERFPSYFPDNYGRIAINCYPLPVKPIGDVYDSTVYKPRWNWSLYLKKQVTGHFGMVLKVGRDHQRWEFHPAQYNYYDFEAAMVKPDQWGWQAATVFSF
jgi:hypothetical protein